jgi:hypothetical protein
MGLCVQIGLLADLVENDPDAATCFEEELARVNRALAVAGLPSHQEPRSLPDLDNRTAVNGYPYSFIHYLRRVAAKRFENPTYVAEPLADGAEPDDAAVQDELRLMRSHLICHSDAEGFYLPTPFTQILYSDDADAAGGGIIGSSYQLLADLRDVAPALCIKLDAGQLTDEEVARLEADIASEGGLWIEKLVWLDLFEAARLSVEHKTAIVFG